MPRISPAMQSTMSEWFDVSVKLKEMKALETKLRKEVLTELFPEEERKEGMNNFALPDNYVAKCGQPYTRKVDPAAFDAIKELLRDVDARPEKLVKWTPELVKAEYNKLTEKQLKVFDDCLITKPGSASLEIVLPKKFQDK